MSTPTPCQACAAMAEVIEKLMSLCDKQQRMLMSFNRAGLNLANQEVELAKLDIERKRSETDAFRAQAQLRRAEAHALAAEETAPSPRFGVTGHKRTRIGTAPATVPVETGSA